MYLHVNRRSERGTHISAGALGVPAPIAAAELGIAIWNAGAPLILSGGSEIDEGAPASYIHTNTPTEFRFAKKVVDFELTLHHPRLGFGNQHFWFRLSFDFNNYDIRNATLIFLRSKSSKLIASEFKLKFQAVRETNETDVVAQMAFDMKGIWNPIGVGVASVWGKLHLNGRGNTWIDIDSERKWVKATSMIVLREDKLLEPERSVLIWEVRFSPPGEYRISDKQEKELEQWYRGLPEIVRQEIEAGSIPVRIDGHASTSRSESKNRALSRRRARQVLKVLKDIVGSVARFQCFAHGEYRAGTPDEVEAEQERRVLVSVSFLRPRAPPKASVRNTVTWLSELPVIGALMRIGKTVEALAMARKQGVRDVNELTDVLFYAKYPERRSKLSRGEPNFEKLRAEWLEIRDRVVRPAVGS
jgi:OmpA family